jgi:hypothetical protein
MAYNNYSISNSKGKLYLKSSEPKDGYEKVNYGTDNSKVTYHKYFDSTQGVLKYFDVKEVEYQGKKLSFLELTLVDGEDNNKISVPLKNTKGNYTDEVKAIVSALNSADVGEPVTFSVKKTTTESKGKTYENLNVYINYKNRLGENGKGLSTGYIPFSEIPKAEKEEDEDLGTTYNFKPVNKYYAQKIKEITAKFASGAASTNPQTSEQSAPPKVDETKSSIQQPVENSQLPF